ncbi:hypothetical protein V5799_011314 [Amblyomma americanum]|uniref:Uncharacterized protein n=1 Tax=Amblyomma americanum TaxID=6943 RepID=A0AAQ4EHG7_AMBAM
MGFLTATAFVLSISQLWIDGAMSTSVDRSSKFPHGECLPDATSPSIGDRAVCRFSRVIDHDPQRIPRDVAFVRCRCPGVLCNAVGDFRCQEVRESLRVAYRGGDGTLRNGTLVVSVSCVCAVARSAMASYDEKFTTADLVEDARARGQSGKLSAIPVRGSSLGRVRARRWKFPHESKT